MLDDAYALCIGIANYAHVRPLSAAPMNDAVDLSAQLSDPQRGGYRADRVRRLLDGQATRYAVLGALDALHAQVGTQSTVFVSFSGHGARTGAGSDYLLTVDSRPDAPDTGITVADLADRLGRLRARKLLLVLDCCHAAAIGELRDPVPWEQPRDLLGPGLSVQAQEVLSRGRGRALFLAARADEAAYESRTDRNGLFTKHLLGGLRGGAVATGGLIRIFDLFDYVQRRVRDERPTQHPVLKAEIEENFAIALAPPSTPAQASPAADGFRHDVYLHALERGPDLQWVRNVLRPALERRGLRTHAADRFRLGSPRLKELERAVTESRYTVAVLSEAYLQSGFAKIGDLMAQHLGLEQSQARLIAVMREPCTPRIGMRMATILDLSVVDEFEAQISRLAEQLSQLA